MRLAHDFINYSRPGKYHHFAHSQSYQDGIAAAEWVGTGRSFGNEIKEVTFQQIVSHHWFRGVIPADAVQMRAVVTNLDGDDHLGDSDYRRKSVPRALCCLVDTDLLSPNPKHLGLSTAITRYRQQMAWWSKIVRPTTSRN
jgi:hypothetical protein